MRRILLGAVVGGLAAVLVNTVFASGGTKVCIPAREGKTITTPKGGACKGGTLTELGAEGKEGRSGTTVVARARSAAAKTTRTTEHPATEYAFENDPLNGATWTQRAGEMNELAGEISETIPSESECTEVGPGTPGKGLVELFVDGVRIGNISVPSAKTTETVVMPIYWPGGGTTRSLFEAGSDISHTLTAKIGDGCGINGGRGGGHFTITSIKIDVLGAR